MIFKLLLSVTLCIFLSVGMRAQTTITLQPDGSCGKDAEVASLPSQDQDNTNYGDSPELNALAGTNGGEPGYQRSLMEFDILSRVPEGSVIQSAYLTLYFDPTSSNGADHFQQPGPNDAWLKKVTSSWDEHSVTWNTQPSTVATNRAYLPASTVAQQDYTIDVTALVQDALNDPDNYFGWLLQQDTESIYRFLLFASSDNPDASKHPKLVISYSSCSFFQLGACNGKDAEVSSIVAYGQDTTNYGNATELNALAGTNGSIPGVQRSFIQWDLTEIPTTATVTSAEVSFYFDPASSNGSEHAGNTAGSLQAVTSPWDEHTITWNTQPGTTTNSKVNIPTYSTPQQDYTNINITVIVQDWVAHPSTNFGLRLSLDNETPYNVLLLCSSDHPLAARRPMLTVCYTSFLGRDEITAGSMVKVYPVPSSDHVKVDIHTELQKNEPISFVLFDLLGREVARKQYSQGSFEFYKNNLANGIYFYQVIINKVTLSQGKIIFE